MNKILYIIFGIFIVLLLCSFSYKVGQNSVEVKTVYEDGHKYVLASINNLTGNSCGIAMVHSEACSCHKK